MPTRLSRLGALVVAASLVACSAPGHRSEIVRYDLGFAAAAEGSPPLAQIDVSAPSWLTADGIAYRLAYADAAARREYAESRWVASPVEMLQSSLRQRFSGGGICTLKVELDEFLQVFDSPQASRQVVAVRATLSAAGAIVDRKSIAVEQPAATSDARGGVGASVQAVNVLSGQLAAWLGQHQAICRATPH